MSEPAATERGTPWTSHLLVFTGWAAFVAFFCWPLLSGAASLLYGDNLTHSLALQTQQARLLQHEGWRFWWPEESGGFPRYAEATGAFFHPLNLIWFRVLDPLRGHDLLFVAQLMLLGLALQFGCALHRVGALVTTAVVATAVVSPLALNMSLNAVYIGGTAAAAWVWVGYERWMSRPDARGFLGLAVTTCLLVLASYPPLLYTTFFLLGIACGLRLALERRDALRRAAGLGAASACGLLLAAPQILPLLELTAQSVRHGDVLVQAWSPLAASLRGLILPSDPRLYDAPFDVTPGLGSLVAVVGLALLPLTREARALSLVPAVAIGLELAAGPAGLLHPLLRGVVPGLAQLRHTLPFGWATLAPLSLVLAGTLGAAGRGPGDTRERSRGRLRLSVGLAAAGFVAVAVAARPLAPAAATWLALAATAALLATFVSLALRGRRGAGLALVAAVAVEAGSLRLGLPRFQDPSPLAAPRPVARFLAEEQRSRPGTTSVLVETAAHHQLFGGLLFGDPRSAEYERSLRYCLAALCPSAQLLDGVSQAEAHEALPLERFALAKETLHAELSGRSPHPPGQRLVDRMRWRHVVVPPGSDALAFAPDLKTVLRDEASGVRVLENPNVGPPLAWRPRAVIVSSARDALRGLPAAGGTLLVERPPSGGFPRWLPRGVRDLLDEMPFTPHERHGEFQLDAPADGFAFAPVPSYPGWRAFVDGSPAELRPADVLGQALPIRAGRHTVELRFTPYSFALGVAVSGTTALGLAVASISAARRAARAPRP